MIKTLFIVCALSILASACGTAVAPATKAPIFAESVPDVDLAREEKMATEKRATQMRKLDTYSKASIGAAAVDNFVATKSASSDRVHLTPPETNYGDLNKPCERRYQIAGFEDKMPMYGSREGAAEYALTRPDLFPPQGKEKEVVVIINEVCLDKYTDSELAVR